jgi:hypothetical protein
MLRTDLKQLENHLGLLDEESREAERLIDALDRACAVSPDPASLLLLKDKVNNEIEQIRQRRQLLERIITDLSALSNQVDIMLYDTANGIREDR